MSIPVSLIVSKPIFAANGRIILRDVSFETSVPQTLKGKGRAARDDSMKRGWGLKAYPLSKVRA
jgi:hypothetical protein